MVQYIKKAAIVGRGPLPYFLRKLKDNEVLVDQDGNVVGAEEVVVYMGKIYTSRNFPKLEVVEIGFMFHVVNDVVDNDPTRTNTGQAFSADEVIFWDGNGWVSYGTPSGASGIQDAINVGVGSAFIFRDKQGDLLTFRSLRSSDGSLDVVTDGNYVTLNVRKVDGGTF